MKNKRSILINQIRQIAGVEGIELIMVEPMEPDYMLVHINYDPDSVIERLTPDEVALRNYNATVKRGQINDKTSFWDFTNKLDEEVNELKLSSGYLEIEMFSDETLTFDPSELADISHVCDAMALRYGIDLHAEKEKKMYINEKRTD